jgi:hypothetical protein
LTFLCVGFYIEAMTASESFDPGGYYAFDLARGAVHTRHGERVLVLSADVIGPLVSNAAKHGDLTAVRALGKHIGEDAARSLGREAKLCTPETVLTHASGVLALLGWGALTLERWGKALVLTLSGAPLLDGDRLGLAALLGGMLTSLGGRDVACVPVAAGAHFVIVHPSIAETIWGWAKEGADLPQIVARLAQEAA